MLRERGALPSVLPVVIYNGRSPWTAPADVSELIAAGGAAPLPKLEEVRTMLAETVREWTEQWVEQGLERGIEQGRAQGIEQGRVEERALLCRQAARKFDAAAGQQLAAALADVTDPGSLAQVGEWIIECGTAAELFTRLADTPGLTPRAARAPGSRRWA